MVCPERKSIEPIDPNVGHGDVSGLQKFVGAAPWASDDVMAEAQAQFADELAPSAAGSPVGVVGVIDESAFTKKGSHSAGVARQHHGRLGKEDNCQVGVFLIGVAPAGSARLDLRLFLPESWCAARREGKGRRDGAHIPEDVSFRTKPQIAAELVRNVAVLGQVELDWVVGDPSATNRRIAPARSGAIGTISSCGHSPPAGGTVSVTKTPEMPASRRTSRAAPTNSPCVAATVICGPAPASRSAATLSTIVPAVEIMSSTIRQGRPRTSPTR
jgi:hypothetical protein